VPKIDLPVFKLDAGTEQLFHHINRPARGVGYGEILEQLCALDDIYLQAIFHDGKPSNTTLAALDAWYERVSEIQPQAVHIYSIDRPVVHSRITLVSPERLQGIAREGERRTGVTFLAYGARVPQNR
jgi:wyosine [tRNA(Phe)-imidazoG37] synthetase (radical SAM superfamily)